MRQELDLSIKYLAEIISTRTSCSIQTARWRVPNQKKPASAYALVSMNAEQKTKDTPEKEYYVPTAEETEKKGKGGREGRKRRMEENKKMRLNTDQEQKEATLKLWEQTQSEIPRW